MVTTVDISDTVLSQTANYSLVNAPVGSNARRWLITKSWGEYLCYKILEESDTTYIVEKKGNTKLVNRISKVNILDIGCSELELELKYAEHFI